MTSIEFIEEFVLKQAGNLQKNKAYLSSLTILTIGIEIMGGFFDKKPLKSPKQSKIRFKAATDKLLGGKYASINSDDYLYETLRNQLVHSLLPGKSIVLDLSSEEIHLKKDGYNLILNPEVLLSDMQRASIKLQNLIAEGIVFEKRIPDNSHEILKWIG